MSMMMMMMMTFIFITALDMLYRNAENLGGNASRG